MTKRLLVFLALSSLMVFSEMEAGRPHYRSSYSKSSYAPRSSYRTHNYSSSHRSSYRPRVRSYAPRNAHHPRVRSTASRRTSLGPRITSSRHRSDYAAMASRDAHGRIKRSASARQQFMRQTGYPHGRKGYVIDHVIPLSKGGTDAPSNMQWQTKAEAKAKDKWERK